MADTFSMADQFKGLPMGDLIGGPLQAACDAQVRLALSTANFIQQVGFMPPAGTPPSTDTGSAPIPSEVRTVSFRFDRPAAVQDPTPVEGGPAVTKMETVDLTVPLLAIIKVPALSITTVDVTFDMEVKNTERSASSQDTHGAFSADASVGWGPFSLKVHVEGSVSTHQENTRETDQSAKYHVAVHAEDKGMPEGLSRVLDMMLQAIAPKSVTPKAPDAQGGGQTPAAAGDTFLPGAAPRNVTGSQQDAPPSLDYAGQEAPAPAAQAEAHRASRRSNERGTYYREGEELHLRPDHDG